MKTNLIWRALSLLGLAAACTNCEESVDMYGVPYVTFSAKGKVTDTSGQPIPGIQVRVDNDTASTLTDGEGRFDIVSESFSSAPEELRKILYFEDIDGEENGSFVDTQAEVVLRRNSGGDYAADGIAVVMTEITPDDQGK